MPKGNVKQSSNDNIQLARFDVDLLKVYKSIDNEPVDQNQALNNLIELFSDKKQKVVKCLMKIRLENNGGKIILKNRTKNEIFEEISLTAMGQASISQLVTETFKAQSLIFLPVKNKAGIWELFIFHPIGMTAEDVVIRLTKMKAHIHHYFPPQTASNDHISYVEGSVTNRSRDQNQLIDEYELDKNSNYQTDRENIYSFSPTFINTWQHKLEKNIDTNSAVLDTDLHSNLQLLNANLKEIKRFMNELFQIMNAVIKRNNEGDCITLAEGLPSKARFVDIIQKIKQTVNICAENERLIYKPSAVEIVNKQFIFLRILGDATLNHQNGRPEIVSGVAEPKFPPSTVQFLSKSLTPENKYYWSILGPNYGFKSLLPAELEGEPIDEFHIRKEALQLHDDSSYQLYRSYPNMNQYDAKLNTPVMQLPHQTNNDVYNTNINTSMPIYRPSSPVIVVDNDLNRPTSYDFQQQPQQHQPQQQQYQQQQYQQQASLPVAPQHHYRHHHHHHHQHPQHHDNSPRLNLPRPSELLKENVISNHVKERTKTNIIRPTNAWEQRQSRFVDSVEIRDGRLGKAKLARSAKSQHDLSVAEEEIVEILETRDNYYVIKNSFGEQGLCPKSNIKIINNY